MSLTVDEILCILGQDSDPWSNLSLTAKPHERAKSVHLKEERDECEERMERVERVKRRKSRRGGGGKKEERRGGRGEEKEEEGKGERKDREGREEHCHTWGSVLILTCREDKLPRRNLSCDLALTSVNKRDTGRSHSHARDPGNEASLQLRLT